jgi:predicted nucleotidyltransferase
MIPELEVHRANLAVLCRRFKVRRLALFGSAARTDFDSARSDVDLLVEFEDAHSPGYADRYLDFALEAEILLGRRVDLVTVRSVVSPVFKQRIEADTVELYAA